MTAATGGSAGTRARAIDARRATVGPEATADRAATGLARKARRRPAVRAAKVRQLPPARRGRERPSFAPVPEVPQRPKPKRLKPGRVHRQALMAALPEEQQPIADQLFRAGLPGVRQAIQDQNVTLAAEGKPTIKPSGIESLAQDLLPRVRVADWLDRADAAKAVVDELDLRDLRSVVTTGADPMVARDDATRQLAAELREALDRRQNEEHEQWLADITAALDVGRVVRALRLSSRPPKAGVRFPPELASRLAEASTAALTPDAASDRWAALVEALAFSPVHSVVAPAAPPEAVSDELRAMVKGVAGAVPQIAALLGIEAPPPGSRPARAPRLPRRPPKPKPTTSSAPRGGRGPAESAGGKAEKPAKSSAPADAEQAATAEPADDEPVAADARVGTEQESAAAAEPAVAPEPEVEPAAEAAAPPEADAASIAATPPEAEAEPTSEATAAPEPTASAPEAAAPTPTVAAEPEPAAAPPEPEAEPTSEAAAAPEPQPEPDPAPEPAPSSEEPAPDEG